MLNAQQIPDQSNGCKDLKSTPTLKHSEATKITTPPLTVGITAFFDQYTIL